MFRLSESVIGPLIIFAFIFAAFFCIPQSVPRNAMSCTSYEVLGSLHVSVSCCKTEYTQIHPVEVIGSNPIAPTIRINHLQSILVFCVAPERSNCSSMCLKSWCDGESHA